MLGTAEGITIWSYFPEPSHLVGKVEAEGGYCTIKIREPELSVPTEPPRVMGVWASDKLFKNYPNDY